MVKTIMISDEVYLTLTKLKNKKESYTRLIARLIASKTSKKNLASHFGKWNMSNENIDKMKNLISESRKSWR